jgi:hypothetical protein
MKGQKTVLVAMLAGLLALGLSGCATQSVTKVGWSEYTTVPMKDYTVVGTIIINPVSAKTVSAELMAEAQKLGAHDIINVRLDTETDSSGEPRILAASAVAITYTETILPKDGASPAVALGGGNTGGSGDGGSKAVPPPPKARKWWATMSTWIGAGVGLVLGLII